MHRRCRRRQTNLHRSPRASDYKNAGLAYLNLVRSPRQSGFGNEETDELVTPNDPLGAAPLLPWQTEVFLMETVHRQVSGKRSAFNGEEGGDHYYCPALDYPGKAGDIGGEGRRRESKLRAASTLRTAASARTKPSEAGTLASSNIYGGSSSSNSRAIGSWRNDASTRFMHMWKQFLDHADAPLDSQYATVRDIYEKLVGRLGIGPKEGSRDKRR